MNKPVLCGVCNKPVWLLNLKNHIKEKHAGQDANATNVTNLAEAQQIIDDAAATLEKILASKKRKRKPKP